MHARLSLSIWAGHVHEHAPQRISALFVERKSVNDRDSPSGCMAGDRSALAETISPPRRFPRRDEDRTSGYADIHWSGGTSTRVAGAAGYNTVVARRRGRCSRCSWHDRRLHTEEKRYTRQARCRRASSYEKLAPPPPPTAPKTRSSAGLSSSSLSFNLSLRPLALVLYRRSTPSLRAFAIRGGVLFFAEWSRGHPLFLSFPLVLLLSLIFFLSVCPNAGISLLLRMGSRTGPEDIFGFFFRYVVLRLARSHPV